jgi:hypothetical protein
MNNISSQQLSQKALKDLRKTLKDFYGEELVNKFNEEELNELGLTFLNLLKIILKHKTNKNIL